ncbi:hypothetical protein D3C87_664330 [compost metagenome]
MEKFTDLAVAQKAYDKTFGELTKEQTAHGKTKEALTKEKEAHEKSKTDLTLKLNETNEALTKEKSEHSETKQIAEDAINKVNAAPEEKSDKVIATVDKVKYEVVFGVDGLTKEAVAKDTDLLSRLVKIGSGALIEVEGK